MYIPRDLEKEIKKYLSVKEIIAVTGARQCGKTTLILNLLKQLKDKKSIKMISFDDIKALSLFENDLDSFCQLYVKNNDIIFIDEVQYAKESGKKLKYIYDNFPIKIIISGSSSSELSIQSLKYLVGRIFIFSLYPFSFKEFLLAQNPSLVPLYEKARYGVEITTELNRYLEEFILFGGYPRVVLAKNKEEKIIVLRNIINTYLLREIKEVLGLKEDFKLLKLIKSLSLQIGNLVNYNELSSLSELSYPDVKNYFNILEKTFICSLMLPFKSNKRTELVKNPKVYFYDLGFRNSIIDNFSVERVDIGGMYENFIFSELVKNNFTPKYWRTKSKAEVDFILEEKEEIIPIEIKVNLSETNLTRSFQSFLEKYHPSAGFICSSHFENELKVSHCKVYFIPHVKLLQRLNLYLNK
ncbi:ATP-binding protein [Candidatus Woesearchaeota archaeon]|nr:ATP-binding protein [Candidatus Woesearchaeota archaeon]